MVAGATRAFGRTGVTFSILYIAASRPHESEQGTTARLPSWCNSRPRARLARFVSIGVRDGGHCRDATGREVDSTPRSAEHTARRWPSEPRRSPALPGFGVLSRANLRRAPPRQHQRRA